MHNTYMFDLSEQASWKLNETSCTMPSYTFRVNDHALSGRTWSFIVGSTQHLWVLCTRILVQFTMRYDYMLNTFLFDRPEPAPCHSAGHLV